MLNKIFYTRWHVMRWVRLLVGILVIGDFIYGLQMHQVKTLDYFILAAGFYFIYKALFNTGCEVVLDPVLVSESEDEDVVDYTEIK